MPFSNCTLTVILDTLLFCWSYYKMNISTSPRDHAEKQLVDAIIHWILLGVLFLQLTLFTATRPPLLLWGIPLMLVASFRWRLTGWYLGCSLVFFLFLLANQFTASNVLIALSTVIGGWITVQSLGEVAAAIEQAAQSGVANYAEVVRACQRQIAANQVGEEQSLVREQELLRQVGDLEQQLLLGEQELLEYRQKTEAWLETSRQKDAFLQQQLVDRERAFEFQLGEQEALLTRQMVDLEGKYARAQSDLGEWQLRVKQLLDERALALEMEVEGEREDPLAIAAAEEPLITTAQPPCEFTPAEAAALLPSIATSPLSSKEAKGKKSKKTDRWANAILSRWS
jgi:hypothetical protein